MSAIMRRRRSLIGLSLIKGSCPEVGVWNPQSSGRDAGPVIAFSISSLARSLPPAPLRAQRTPAAAGSFSDPDRTPTVHCNTRNHVDLQGRLEMRRSIQDPLIKLRGL